MSSYWKLANKHSHPHYAIICCVLQRENSRTCFNLGSILGQPCILSQSALSVFVSVVNSVFSVVHAMISWACYNRDNTRGQPCIISEPTLSVFPGWCHPWSTVFFPWTTLIFWACIISEPIRGPPCIISEATLNVFPGWYHPWSTVFFPWTALFFWTRIISEPIRGQSCFIGGNALNFQLRGFYRVQPCSEVLLSQLRDFQIITRYLRLVHGNIALIFWLGVSAGSLLKSFSGMGHHRPYAPNSYLENWFWIWNRCWLL